MTSPARRVVPFVLLLLLISAAAHASTTTAESATRGVDAPQATFRFDIPAGPLDAALAAFESLTGITISPPPHATVQGLTSPGVSGTYTADQALQRLLGGTGLTYRLSGPKRYALEITPVSEMVEVRANAPYLADSSLTGTRTLTPLRDVPQAVTVILQSMIADQRMQGMADVVRYVPGVVMGQGEGNRDAPVLRGNSTTADFFVDGVRDDVQYFRDLYNVERIEAFKGPNAMIFGRGGAGGVINRTTRQADWNSAREITVQGGSFTNRRVSIDLDHPITAAVASRLTGVYENSGSYRQGADVRRYGLNPTVAFMAGTSTTVRLGYERFHDDRTADRGIPSLGDRPLETNPSTFFGDPDISTTFVTVNALTSMVDHKLRGTALLRNRTRYADYDKFYQNVYPGSAVNSATAMLSLSAYNNATARRNFFNQTDLNFTATSGSVKHVLAAGGEFGRQATDNVRSTGYFTSLAPNATSFPVRADSPTVSVPVAFRQSATDADNRGVARLAAVYGQDQVEFSRHLQAVVGLRVDRFNVDFHNNRTGADFSSRDTLVSPRLGAIVKPVDPLSLYASYSLTYAPRAGEQLSSLSLTNQALDPERFTNYEIGAKWDLRPTLALTAALYRLDRTNVVVPDPYDTTRSLLVKGQQTSGFELGLSGSVTRGWRTIAAYAYQDGTITQTLSASARAGAKLAQVPAHSFSIWNRYDVSRRWGAGLGIIRSTDRFTSTDNTVVLPAFTRVDGAVFANLTRALQAQMNVENVFDTRYYAFSNGNNNITPGSPRAVRLSLTTRF
jgi:catecholate siderophore receptor